LRIVSGGVGAASARATVEEPFVTARRRSVQSQYATPMARNTMRYCQPDPTGTSATFWAMVTMKGSTGEKAAATVAMPRTHRDRHERGHAERRAQHEEQRRECDELLGHLQQRAGGGEHEGDGGNHQQATSLEAPDEGVDGPSQGARCAPPR
jgi:hypothetical protein